MFTYEQQSIPEVILVKPKVFSDERGFFMETYSKDEFNHIGIMDEFVQDNHSKSAACVLRGLHYQKYPNEQSKLVRCIKGKILDVAVDIRQNSPTYLKYVKVELSEDNKCMLYIPEGFAHGFVVLSDGAEIHYKTGCRYVPHDDAGIVWNDEDINIDWGIDFEPILSEKDKNQPTIKEMTE